MTTRTIPTDPTGSTGSADPTDATGSTNSTGPINSTDPTDLINHFEISTLISGFFRALDDRAFGPGWGRAFFTDDLRTTTPVGDAVGDAAVRHQEEAVARFARTQHVASDVLVDTAPDGRTATATWNALMTHVHRDETLRARGADAQPLFTVGGVFRAALRRTRNGWRMRGMSVEATWLTGDPPPLPGQVARRVADLPATRGRAS